MTSIFRHLRNVESSEQVRTWSSYFCENQYQLYNQTPRVLFDYELPWVSIFVSVASIAQRKRPDLVCEQASAHFTNIRYRYRAWPPTQVFYDKINVRARGSFDLPISGLWAYHASSAPSCYLYPPASHRIRTGFICYAMESSRRNALE